MKNLLIIALAYLCSAWTIGLPLVVADELTSLVKSCAKDEKRENKRFNASCYYLTGNSLTWDTVPSRLDGDVQWHVDCGVALPQIYARPNQPCVEESTIWPKALHEKQYDFVSVQPHYGSTLMQDVETISNWMKLQPKGVFIVHSGWALQAQRANEFASLATPDQMTHSPHYIRALVSELRQLFPEREIRQTLAQNLLAQVADDIDAGRSPMKNVAELYRDSIHKTHDFTPLNDDGLRAITQVPISGRLWFAHTKFTDAGTAGFSNLKELKRCGIGSTDQASSGESVAALAKLALEDLALLDNQATPAGLAYAAKIATLRRLDVSHAPTVTDESLRGVGLMPALEEFNLGSANVTDAGLMELAVSRSLKKMSLTGLKLVTPAGIERLRKACPELQVEVK